MSSSVRKLLPYNHLMDPVNDNPRMAKVQALVSSDDKRTVLASLGGDDGVLTLTIQHAFKRTAEFIRSNGLNAYDPDNYARVIAFIRDGSDTCPSGLPAPHSHTGGPKGGEHPSPSTSLLTPTSDKIAARGSRIRERAKVLQAKQNRERES